MGSSYEGGERNATAADVVTMLYSDGRDGFTLKNHWLEKDYGQLASQKGVRRLAGDYDKDGRMDVALVGGEDWTNVFIAYAKPDRKSFDVVAHNAAAFEE